jgi:hypothetical protein
MCRTLRKPGGCRPFHGLPKQATPGGVCGRYDITPFYAASRMSFSMISEKPWRQDG